VGTIIEQRVRKIKEDLDFFDDELEKYQFIIDLGKKLSAFETADKVAKNIVHGCTSQVWLTYHYDKDLIYFKGTSDAVIVKGLVYILLEIFSKLTKDEIIQSDEDILYELGLSEIITPNRQSGVMGMIKKIRQYAQKE